MLKTNGLADIFILNTVVLLLILITGALSSPLYFLIYFLAFGITFIFEPATVFVFTLGAIAIFLPEALKNDSFESFIKIGSIALVSPLGYFFGQGYKDREKIEKEKKNTSSTVEAIAETISEETQDVLQAENSSLSKKSKSNLKDILNESESLKRVAKKNDE